MSLRDTWEPRVDGIDIVLADDVNALAKAIIENEENIEKLPTKDYVNNIVGGVKEILINANTLADSYINGDGVV